MLKADPSELIALNNITRRMPNIKTSWGTSPSRAILRAWCDKGLKGIRLNHLVIDGRRYTTIRAVRRFIKRTTTTATDSRMTLTPAALVRVKQLKGETYEKHMA